MSKKLDLNSKKEPKFVGMLMKIHIDILGLDMNEKQILIWNDRLKYIEKHKSDFDSEKEWKKHVESIPEIIEYPDYIGLHPSNNSIQFIKTIDKNMLVGVRIKNKGKLVVRTAYPISNENLQIYLKSGTIKSVKGIQPFQQAYNVNE